MKSVSPAKIYNNSMFTMGVAIFIGFICILATDLFAPALPMMEEALETSRSLSQLTIGIFFLGVGASQLFYGPFSDKYGRKPALILGISIAIFGSLIAYLAQNIETLLIGRLIQGIGAAAGVAMMRATASDLYDGKQLAIIGTVIMLVFSAIPSLAPLAGSYLITYFGWRSNFATMLILFIVGFSIILFYWEEPNKLLNKTAMRWKQVTSNYKYLCQQYLFMSYALLAGLSLTGLISYITISPHLLQDTLGLKPVQYGWTTVFTGSTLLFGSLINFQLIKKFTSYQRLKIGLVLLTCGSCAMLLLSLSYLPSVINIIVPFFVLSLGTSLIMANASAAAIAMFPHMAGASGALWGTTQMGLSFAGGVIASQLPITNANGIGGLFFIISVIQIIIFAYIKQSLTVETQSSNA